MKAIHPSSQVCHLLTEDHRRTELLLDALESVLKTLPEAAPMSSETADEVREMLALLQQDLAVHFACEEQCLFPVLSLYHPMVLMEVEHEDILALQHEANTLLNDSQQSVEATRQFCQAGEQLIDALRSHIAREDAGIFPQAERELTDTQKHEVVVAMNALRQRASHEPVPPLYREPKTAVPFQAELRVALTQPVQIAKLLESAKVTVKQVSLMPGESLASHWVPKVAIMVGLSGEAELETSEGIVPLGLGMGVVLSARMHHAVRAKTESRFLVILLAGSCGGASAQVSSCNHT